MCIEMECQLLEGFSNLLWNNFLINLFMPSTGLFAIFLITSRYQCTIVGCVNAGLQRYYTFALTM